MMVISVLCMSAQSGPAEDEVWDQKASRDTLHPLIDASDLLHDLWLRFWFAISRFLSKTFDVSL